MAKLRLRGRVLGELGRDGFVALPGKGEAQQLDALGTAIHRGAGVLRFHRKTRWSRKDATIRVISGVRCS